MRYEQIVDAFCDDAQHINSLISARGVKLSDEVDSDFIDVLREDGYVIPDLTDFEELIR